MNVFFPSWTDEKWSFIYDTLEKSVSQSYHSWIASLPHEQMQNVYRSCFVAQLQDHGFKSTNNYTCAWGDKKDFLVKQWHDLQLEILIKDEIW